MSSRFFCFVAAVALLASIATASAKNPVTLTDGQLDKVTAGAGNPQIPVNSAAFANGSNGFGEVHPAEGNRPVQSLLEIRQDRVMIQKWDLSCGAAALGTLLHDEFGEPVTEKDIAHALMGRAEYVAHPQLVQLHEGFSLLDLKRFVQAYRSGSLYKGEGLGQLEFNDLIERAPVLVPINALGYNHYVIFRGIMGNRVLLADPAWGNRTMTIDKFQRMWIDNGEPMGHIGFVVQAADGRKLPNRMQPKPSDFVMLR
jgi:predicted double-glycine peptidase